MWTEHGSAFPDPVDAASLAEVHHLVQVLDPADHAGLVLRAHGWPKEWYAAVLRWDGVAKSPEGARVQLGRVTRELRRAHLDLFAPPCAPRVWRRSAPDPDAALAAAIRRLAGSRRRRLNAEVEAERAREHACSAARDLSRRRRGLKALETSLSRLVELAGANRRAHAVVACWADHRTELETRSLKAVWRRIRSAWRPRVAVCP